MMFMKSQYGSWYIESLSYVPADRLTGVALGVSDLQPRDQQQMTPTELNARRCGQVTAAVEGGEKVTLTCPPGGVTGRYLIVQTLGRTDYLGLCEVEAGRAFVLLFILIMFFCRLFRFSIISVLANIDKNYISSDTLLSNSAGTGLQSDVIMLITVALLAWSWTSLLPTPCIQETTQPLVSDLLNSTCSQLNFDDRDIYLRGRFTGTFHILFVTLTTTTSLAFGPGPGQASCHPMTSSLMTHQRSVCNQTFCVVPTTCHYTGKKVISTVPTLWEYDFSCVCGQAWCNELWLWLWADSVQGQVNRVNICEVGVIQYGN